MNNQNTLLSNISYIYRSMNRYLDNSLAKYQIGSGQLLPLLIINENEGITMQSLTKATGMDKGTITKNLQRLFDLNYIYSTIDENDKRVKHLYLTVNANNIINDLYSIRNSCSSLLIGQNNIEQTDEIIHSLATNAIEIDRQQTISNLKIQGLQKLSLIDYPEKMAATIFLSGCNFKCPFCHNKDLVFVSENVEYINSEDVLDYLNKRKGILDGVCISGGEPTFQNGLEDFIIEIKQLGYKVKLDTNGFNPDILKHLIDEKLVDYVAMDIKNSFIKYGLTSGVSFNDDYISRIKESIELLKAGRVDYEFRTTVVEQFHNEDDFIEIGKILKGAKRYYLQPFRNGVNVIDKSLSAPSTQKLDTYVEILKQYIDDVLIR